MNPPVELNRPTILNIIAIISYCLTTLFHIIAYATDNWASLLLNGVRWRVGLWQGCRDVDGTEHCTTDIFDDKVFQTGSDWHLGSRIMMTLALILIFFLEFTLISYACIKNLEKYKSQLVATTIILSLSAAFCHLLVLIMYGTEVGKLPESGVRASYSIVIICVLLELFLPCAVYVDKNKRFPSSSKFIIPKRALGINNGSSERRDSKPKEVDLKRKKLPPFTIDGTSVSMRTSTTSLSEIETYKRFAAGDEPDPSLVSIGSAESINTRSTMYTHISHDYTDRSSIESGV